MTTPKPLPAQIQLADEDEMRQRLANIKFRARRQIQQMPSLAETMERWYEYLIRKLAGRQLPAEGVLAGTMGALSTFMLDEELDDKTVSELRTLIPFVLEVLINDHEVRKEAFDLLYESITGGSLNVQDDEPSPE